MIFAFNSAVVYYLFQNFLLSIIFYIISILLKENFFFVFFILFLINPILLFLFRENVDLPNVPTKYVSPCDGIVQKITPGKETEIFILSNFVCSYSKRSPVDGKIINIEQNRDITIIEIENEDGESIFFEIKPLYIRSRNIQIYCKINEEIKKGQLLCFLEFGSIVKLTISGNVNLLIAEKSELKSGTMGIAERQILSGDREQ